MDTDEQIEGPGQEPKDFTGTIHPDDVASLNEAAEQILLEIGASRKVDAEADLRDRLCIDPQTGFDDWKALAIQKFGRVIEPHLDDIWNDVYYDSLSSDDLPEKPPVVIPMSTSWRERLPPVFSREVDMLAGCLGLACFFGIIPFCFYVYAEVSSRPPDKVKYVQGARTFECQGRNSVAWRPNVQYRQSELR